ncbi:MAG: hypothetical protein V3T08_09795 [Gemmatimonadota bacterium]
MNGDTQLILDRIDEHRKETSAELKKHGECIATLVERTKNTIARLDRADKRAGVISAITGAASSVAVIVAKSLGMDP